jgi:putative peptidoglycan lipid II flippase
MTTDSANPAPTPAGVTRPSRNIASAAAVVMLFFVLSRVLGLVREVVIAAQFGAGSELDAYLAAFRVPDLLFQLVAGGALGSAFIPTFASYWAHDDQVGAWLLFSRCLNLVILLLTLIAALAAWLALPLVQSVIAPGFSIDQQLLTAHLMRWMLLSTVIFGASGLIMGALNGMHHFLLPAAAPLFYNGAIILSAWVLVPTLGITGLALGVVIGAALHLAIQIPGLWQVRARYSFSFEWQDPGVREVMHLMGPRILGLLFVQIHFLINTNLASNLDAGSLVALNYAWLLMLLPQGILGQSLAAATFPTLADQVARGDLDAARQTISRTLRLILFLSIPAAIGLFMLGEPIVSALLERRAFDTTATQQVAYALRFYAVGLVAHAALEIVVRGFYALHNTRTPVFVGVLAMLLNIGLSLAWVNWLGFGGLALANSVATAGEILLLLWLLRRPLQGLAGQQLLKALGQQIMAGGLLGVTLWWWISWSQTIPLLTNGPLAAWLIAGGGLMLGGLIYLGSAVLMRSEETAIAGSFLRRRLRGN